MLYEAKEKIKIQKGTGIDKNTGENTNKNSNRAWNCGILLHSDKRRVGNTN